MQVITYIDINSKSSLIIGGFLNILLIWLVIKKTPKEMSSYSKIVMQTCFCDLTNLVLGDIVQPVLFIYDGVAVVVSVGLAGKMAYPWNAYFYYVWIFFAFFAIIGIIVQFLYRYMVVCKNKKIGTRGYFVMLGIVAVGLALYFVWLMSLSFPNKDAMVDDPYVSGLLGHNSTNLETFKTHLREIPPEIRLSLKGTGGETFWIMWHLGFIVSTVTVYVCIAYFGHQMIMYTKKNVIEDLKKNIEMNKQLTRNLILQAIIPLAALVGWVICAYACIFGNVVSGPWFNIFTSLVATPTQNWTSVFNPLITILTIKSYRRSVLPWKKDRVEPRTSRTFNTNQLPISKLG